MNLYSLYERIPSDWIGLAIGCFVAWGVTKIWNDKGALAEIRDLLINVFLVYVIFSRFVAGLLLHFNLNLRNDLLSALDGSSVYGWLIGVVAVSVYLILELRKRPVLRTAEGYAQVTWVALTVIAIVFLYDAVISLHPYRLEMILRSIGAVVFMAIAIRTRHTVVLAAAVWSALGAWLLVTSMMVPQADSLLWFSSAQWWYIILLAAGWVCSRKDVAKRLEAPS